MMKAGTAASDPKPLTGRTVFLRRLRVEDVTQDYVDWMNDPDVVRFTESRFAVHTLQSTRDFVAGCRKSSSSVLFGIFEREGSLHVGNIKLGPVNPHHGTADIGLIIGRKSFWGRGIATEAIALVRDHAFGRLGIEKLTAGCYAGNDASCRAFIKAGFVIEGTRRLQCRLEGRRVDVWELGLINPALAAAEKL